MKTLHLLLIFILIFACKKNNAGPNSNNPGNSNPTTYSGVWNLLPLIDSPDYANKVGDMLCTNTHTYALAMNKFGRYRLISVDHTGDTNHFSTPFDQVQSIGFTTMSNYASGIYVGYTTFLGNTRIYHHIFNGSSWTELPEITVPNYSFNNRIIKSCWFKNQLYLAAASTDSTYLLKYNGSNWETIGGKAFGPVGYYLDLKAGSDFICMMTYNPPSSSNPGLILKSFNGTSWFDENFNDFSTSDELVFPVIDINSNQNILFGFLTYSGSYIYTKTQGSNTWNAQLEYNKTDKFYLKPRFDKQNPSLIHSVIISHFAQVTQAIWGLAKINNQQLINYNIDYDKDNPGYKVIFDPIDFSRLVFEPGYDQKLYFLFGENRSPFVCSFVRFTPR